MGSTVVHCFLGEIKRALANTTTSRVWYPCSQLHTSQCLHESGWGRLCNPFLASLKLILYMHVDLVPSKWPYSLHLLAVTLILVSLGLGNLEEGLIYTSMSCRADMNIDFRATLNMWTYGIAQSQCNGLGCVHMNSTVLVGHRLVLPIKKASDSTIFWEVICTVKL